ncbi:unnamed protein product [Spodoptera littoralis]|uniref:Alpha-1,6-mannosyl-glycoprotein 2-beta-N-acetylglucosaminyltransferase n=1 Tax=Spodoptera littoralis TaxID=7109 RepID=A0A9P0HVW8_SPOLI|nr:unnamed protein product [Spodoptera littoralis]CAH1635482.1 unnamed protein product [Spodoptera littoralis]
MATICFKVYLQVSFIKKQTRDIIYNYQDDVSDNSTYTDYVAARIKDKMQTMQQILKIKSQIKDINLAQTVHNTRLGHFKSNLDSHIIVVLVHSDTYYFSQLLLSLKTAIGIKDTFIIFSHDYFSESINALIRDIKFAKYIQIFFPYSIQLHPNVYPGTDGQHCSEGYVCKKSKARDPEAAQSKQHWWWTVNQVFDNLNVTRSIKQFTVLFLEDGDFVTPDIFYVFKLLKKVRLSHFSFCEVINLGAYDLDLSSYTKKTLVSVEIWTGRSYRSGIAFDRQTWNSLKSNSEEFCNHNDYNWDSSLRHVGFKKWDGNVYMIAIPGTRVIHIDKCGRTNGDDGCQEELKVKEVKKFIRSVRKGMFPRSYVMVANKVEDFDRTAAGFWEDVRDKELCMYFTTHSVWY